MKEAIKIAIAIAIIKTEIMEITINHDLETNDILLLGLVLLIAIGASLTFYKFI